ncbi:MAG: T9SS type A sorting domain-containing protein [Catalinimonas sp.]
MNLSHKLFGQTRRRSSYAALLFLFASTFNASAQMQLGADIKGEGEGDLAGWSVALSASGDTVAVGSPLHSSGFILSGRARVFVWDGAAWMPLGQGIDGSSAVEEFGRAVALSADGRRLAVGAPYSNANSQRAGEIRVYELTPGTDDVPDWELLGTSIEGDTIDGELGFALSISADGNRLAAGAPGTPGGYARVYEWDGTAWPQIGSDIVRSELGTNARSVTLSADGNRLLVDGTFPPRVFDWDGSDWDLISASLKGSNVVSRTTLSGDGNHLLLAILVPTGEEFEAFLRTFVWDGTAWNARGDNFSIGIGGSITSVDVTDLALSADGNRCVVGTDGALFPNGAVSVYDWNGTMWQQQGDQIVGEETDDNAGYAVALSDGGLRLAVGTPYANDPNTPNDTIEEAGNARVFELTMPSSAYSEATAAWQLYPNPTRDHLRLTCRGVPRVDVRVHDVMGRLRQQTTLVLVGGHATYDVRALPAGVYCVTVGEGRARRTWRLVKEQ